MSVFPFHQWLPAIVLLTSSWNALHGEESVASAGFATSVRPVLKEYCSGCHGPTVQESGLRLDTLSADLLNDRAVTERWHAVLNALNSGEMPPDDERQMSDEDHQRVTAWIRNEVDRALEARKQTDGRVVLRRLNRIEYQNTMTDLLGLDMDYVRDLPPDAVSADGFTNNGSSLQMSPIQLEYYLATARRALDRVIVSGNAPKVFDYTFEESNLDKWLGQTVRSNRLQRRQEFLATMIDDYPEEGEFLVRVTLAAELKTEIGFPLLEVSVGYRPDTQILLNDFELVEVTSLQKQTFEFRGRLENFPMPVRGQGKYPGLVVRVRNVYDDGAALPAEQKDGKKRVYPDEPRLPAINVQSVEFRGPFYQTWPPASHRELLFESALQDTDESAYVAEVLRRFMPRAYRRAVDDVEVGDMVEFFQDIRPEFPAFEDAVRETLALVLIRPDFLYLMEPAGDLKRPVADGELASRLSYFLWSTMPDERLMELSAQNKLHEAETLAAEVDRMLYDSRSDRFVDQFTQQWLRLNNVHSVAVNHERYPAFDEALKRDMIQESQSVFTELLRHNESAMNLLSSDFTMLNERLAKHYGFNDVWGHQFRRVSFDADMHRGGLLSHGSFLLSNSTGRDSHPVRRAVWIRDRLLNDPPAPPPPDVPSLDDVKDADFVKLSVREQLTIHRDKQACNRCHRDIDPWGIALENFDAVGLWRTEFRPPIDGNAAAIPIVAKDRFPDGREIAGVDQLKSYLLAEHKSAFARSLVTRLLTYALGRQVELSDERAIHDITTVFTENDYRLRDLVKQVVMSDVFRTK